eukprot:6214328-Pleurochrysis_carterae.AAC.3
MIEGGRCTSSRATTTWHQPEIQRVRCESSGYERGGSRDASQQEPRQQTVEIRVHQVFRQAFVGVAIVRRPAIRRPAQHALPPQDHGDSDHRNVQRERCVGPAIDARVGRGLCRRLCCVGIGEVLGFAHVASAHGLRVRRLIRVVALTRRRARRGHRLVVGGWLEAWYMGARSFFGELSLAALCPTAVVADVVHHNTPLPIVRVAVVAVRPDVDVGFERAHGLVLGLRRAGVVVLVQETTSCLTFAFRGLVREEHLFILFLELERGERLDSSRVSRVLDASRHQFFDSDERSFRTRLSGADAKGCATLVRCVLKHGFGVALAVEQGDHCFVELVAVGVVASRRQRCRALLGGISGLLAGHVAFAIGALSVPVGPVAIPATRVAFVPGRVFEFRVPWWISRALAVAFLALRLVVRVARSSQECTPAFIELHLLAQLARFVISEYIADGAQRERKVAESRKH